MPMALHLLKLCVGAESVEDHKHWVERRLAAQKAAGVTPEQFHTTRMVPKRAAELLEQNPAELDPGYLALSFGGANAHLSV